MDIVIIEDEELAARRLEGMIRSFDPGINILARLESIKEAVNWFRSHHEPDLIFLDIHLEDGLSFQIFDKVAVKSPIIFTTAFDEYAIKAFKLKSIDYLLKPITQEDLNAAILKYKNWNVSSKSVLDVGAFPSRSDRK
jgi:two-component SAPR family response regulator